MKRYFKIILMLSIAFYLFPANASAISVQYGLSVDDYVQLYIVQNPLKAAGESGGRQHPAVN